MALFRLPNRSVLAFLQLQLLWLSTLHIVPKVHAEMIDSQELCMLCEKGVDQISWPNAPIESSGMTCSGMALTMAMAHTRGSQECQTLQDKWRDVCCDAIEPPPDIEVFKPEAEEYNPEEQIEKIGTNQRCGMCYNGDYPQNGTTLTCCI